MLTVKFGEQSYSFVLDEELKTLTGHESMLAEEYLGGWDQFRSASKLTKSTVVIVWLAKRSAGEQTTFTEIEETPGLLFGDVFELTDDGEDTPEDPMVEPAHPLAETNGSAGSTGGTPAAASTRPLSVSTGDQ